MTGILFFGVWCLWFVISLIASIWFGKRFKNFFVKAAACLAMLAVLLPLPLLDEIRAQPQMAALCREGAVLKIDAERIKGRKIRLAFEPSNAYLEGTRVPIRHTKVVFRDSASGESLGSFGEYYATGGFFIRALGISNSASPVWMTPTYCSPSLGAEQMASLYQFEIVK